MNGRHLVSRFQFEQVDAASVESESSAGGDGQWDVVSLVAGLGREDQLGGGDIELSDETLVGPGMRGGQLDHSGLFVGRAFEFESIARDEVRELGMLLAIRVALDQDSDLFIQPEVTLDPRRHVPHFQAVSVVGDLLEHDDIRDGVAVIVGSCRPGPWQEDHEQ